MNLALGWHSLPCVCGMTQTVAKLLQDVQGSFQPTHLCMRQESHHALCHSSQLRHSRKPAGCTALAVAEDSPFHVVSSTHLLTAASCPHLLWSQAMVEMPSCSGITLYICSHAARSSRSSSPCALCRQEQGGGRQACHQVGLLAAGSFPAPRPREVPQLTIKHLHGHSCSYHLEVIKVSPSINPSACSGLSGNRVQFSIRPRLILQGVYFLLKVLSEAISPWSTSEYLLSGCKCFPQCSKLSLFLLTAL